MTAVVDSVILIDHLNGVPAATLLLEDHDLVYASSVSWIEVMAGAVAPGELAAAEDMFEGITVVGLTPEICQQTVTVRRNSRLKLPDAIILATAQVMGHPLTTRNTKDFAGLGPDITFPYAL